MRLARARAGRAEWTGGYTALGRRLHGERRTSRLLRQRERLFAAVGMRFALTRVSSLLAMIDGQPVQLPPCLVAGRAATWDFWWPHLGIVVDLHAVDEVEQVAKVEWANAHGVLYCSPSVNGTERGEMDFGLLAEAAARRRGA